MSKADIFIFTRYEADWETGNLSFFYEVERGDERIPFVEQWQLGNWYSDIEHTDALERALQALHLIVGVSYFKAYCPLEIQISDYSLSKDQAEFWNVIYTKGLGEFFYKNDINFKGLINFPYDDTAKRAMDVQVEDKALVLHGGGKDSIVTAEIVKESKMPFDLFCLRPQEIQENVARVMNKEIVGITRVIDPTLLTLQSEKKVFIGHIPVTAFYTFAGVLTAVIGGYKYVIVSSEHSSSYGNVYYLDTEVNHQWSKSEEAEGLMRSYIKKHIVANIEYFSMLRPWYEIKVAERFSQYSQYFNVFSSSNHNFKLSDQNTSQRWEYDSPKTVFVFAILSAFLSKEQMISIFGDNLYDKPELIPVFRELLGLVEAKPFECVGTPEEMLVAMHMAYEKGDYAESAAMRMLNDEVLAKRRDIEALRSKVFAKGNTENIPEVFKEHL